MQTAEQGASSPTPSPRAMEVAQVEVEGAEKDKDEVDLNSVPFGTRLSEVAKAFLPMGFIAFGGPQAHIALFLKTFVDTPEKKKWLDEQRFMELMSLGQAMPGPTSTQMATAMGISRAGVLGGMVSFWLFDWVGFAVQLGVGTAIHLRWTRSTWFRPMTRTGIHILNRQYRLSDIVRYLRTSDDFQTLHVVSLEPAAAEEESR